MQYFSVTSVPIVPNGVNNLATQGIALNAYPNPAQNTVRISVSGIQNVNGTLQVFDALGRAVLTATCDKAENDINISSLGSGAYSVVFTDSRNSAAKMQTRLVVIK